MRDLAGSFARFLLSGGINTALTYALYLLLIRWIPYWLAYSVSFAAGILLAYGLNRCFVFRQHRGLRSVIGVPLVYLAQYGAGLVVLWVWVRWLGMDPRWGPLCVAALTVPLMFWLSRWVFTQQPS